MATTTQRNKPKRISTKSNRGADEEMSTSDKEEEKNTPQASDLIPKSGADKVRAKGGIPFQDRPKGELSLISKKGGESTSIAKSDAQKWAHIKKRIADGRLRTTDPEWLIEKIENSKAMAADILTYMEEIKASVHPMQRIALLNAQKDMMKVIHGEMIKTENTNINVNVDFNQVVRDAYARRMAKMKEDSEKTIITEEVSKDESERS
jgi:hypothetical protein